jgi:superfamily II RNA helicase
MTTRKRDYRPPGKRVYRKKRGGIKKGLYENPRLDPQLKNTFKKIGIPKPTPFRPDRFQLEALERIKDVDILVSAPTGAGKTWIASQTISRYLDEGLKVWYASPLKALSNSIYLEFGHEFGGENCGILTGDRKENPGAPIIVGTTEILRNQLYDAMHKGTDIEADLVILDEAHYLSDPDRGVVWEEVLIYLPPRVRLLLLSATISNGEEICSWLQENRRVQAEVVISGERPVPLEMLFLFPDGLIAPLSNKRGLTPRIRKFMTGQAGGRRRRPSGKLNFGEIIKVLREFDLLPTIFFLKSRMDCDQALLSCHHKRRSHDQRDLLKKELKSFLRKYPHLEEHRQITQLLGSGVGSHHAGQLPYWKILIEKMMNKGYLEAIFSTSTVAAGVNFPARTVVLVQSDRYNGHEFTNLTATDLHQMTGRAGRRGKDNIGFALVVPGLHQDPQLIYELRDSTPEPLMSQIHINFSMTLNLLLSHKPLEVKNLLNRSFASFQERKSGSDLQRKWEDMLKVLRKAIPKGKCDTDDPYEILENIQKKTELERKAKQLTKEIRNEEMLNLVRDHLNPGRLFLHKNKGVYVVFHTYMEQGRLICAAHNIQKTVRVRRRKFRLRKVHYQQIKMLFNYRVDLNEDYSLLKLQRIFDAVPIEDLDVLKLEPSETGQSDGQSDSVQKRLKALPCDECEHDKVCKRMMNKKLKNMLGEFRTLAYQMEGMGGGLWMSFKRHVRFLRETGFVDETDRLTRDGIWATKLRLDHPLLIAEAIRKGGFSELSSEIMAGCIAPFVWDRVQEVELTQDSPINLKQCEEAFWRILEQIENIRKLKVNRGFENPQVLFWPAAAIFLWAKGVSWDRLLSFIPVDEGDMASLIVRTADHLRQVTNLKETHPGLTTVSRKAMELILREPVLI